MVTLQRLKKEKKNEVKIALSTVSLSFPKIAKEKHERQPNWTEYEKRLLLWLMRMHQRILENKSSHTLIIERKSEAWDGIAQNVKAAVYNRSKERLFDGIALEREVP
ncbi:uncharacterized protein ACN2A1_009539 isoform 3-T3 [Glossina fuscipes fuscipes]